MVCKWDTWTNRANLGTEKSRGLTQHGSDFCWILTSDSKSLHQWQIIQPLSFDFCFGVGQAMFVLYSFFFFVVHIFFTRTNLVQHHSKRARTCLACRAETDMAASSIFVRNKWPGSPSQKSEWPALSTSSTPAENTLSTDSTIQPGQRTTEQTVTPAPWSQKKKNSRRLCEGPFEKDRILPIPELVEAEEPKILSFVISDLRSKRLPGLTKETFEELLKTAGVPCRYFCWRSFT